MKYIILTLFLCSTFFLFYEGLKNDPKIVPSNLIMKNIPKFKLKSLQNEFLQETDLMTDEPKLVNFFASWCPPCKAIAPKFEALSTEYPDISFLKIDIDENPEAAGDAGIRSVPTFQFANGQSKLAEFAGADESALADNIRKLQSA